MDPELPRPKPVPPPLPPPPPSVAAEAPATPPVIAPVPPPPPVRTRLPAGVSGAPTVAAAPDLEVRLQELRRDVRRGRRLSLYLATGVLLAALAAVLCWWLYFLTAVSTYARLDPDVQIRRDEKDPSRLILVYRPLSKGKVGFRRVGADREAELLDRVEPAAVDAPQTFQWRTAGSTGAETFLVTYRDGMGLATARVEVPACAQAAPTGLYAWRTLANRLEWIGRFGGSAASERAVNRGLQWLARHQGPDGRWSSRCLAAHPDSQCRKDVPCSGEGGLFDMAHTGLTLLAFQAGGHYDFNGNNYSENVRRGLDWLVAHQQADGALVQPEGDGPRPTPRRRRLKGPANPFYQEFMYEHGMATFALAEACAIRKAMGQPRHGAYFQAAEKAIRFLYQMQHDDGGWRYTPNPREPSDTSVSGWQVLALKSAREAGLPLSPDCVQKARRFFDACAMPDGRTNYQPRTLHTEATTGVGMLARQFLFDEAHAPLVRTAANRLADYAAGSESKPSAWTKERDYYLWYNCTLAMFQAGGQPWKRWNAAVRDTLVGLQDGSPGCQRGSWSPETQRDQRGGRVYTTALATLCLEVYYRYAKEAAGEALDVTAQPPPAAAKP